MAANPLVELQKLGQSIWYDNIRRSLILTGDLQAKIEGDALRGVTSNPAIFEKAIAGSTDYNESLKELAKQGKRAQEIYEILAVGDIQMAADLLQPVYKRTDGLDGYVSLEVSPLLAQDTQKTIDEAESQKWDWVETEVWTGRMLATLENGVKGGRSNAYFIKQGLSAMTIAHVAISQSRCGPH